MKNQSIKNAFTEGLTDGYVSKLLNRQQIPITPETIELKRQHIRLKRIIKKLNQKYHG